MSLEKYRSMHVGDLIDTLIVLRTQTINDTQGMSEVQRREAQYAITALNELLDPVASALDAVKEADIALPETQNFDVMEKSQHELEPGWYIAKFIVTEVVEIRNNSKGRYVIRCGEDRHRSLAEFKFIQKVMFQPGAPEEPETIPTIEVNFADIWSNIGFVLPHLESVKAKTTLVEIMNMFQNPGIIKHKDS